MNKVPGPDETEPSRSGQPQPFATAESTVRKPAHAMDIRHIAEDFDAADPVIEAWFRGDRV
jgi:hypothetical protein